MNRLNKWKHWPAFWQLVREYDVCPESEKERLGECEIYLHFTGYESKNFMNLCNWGYSGFAGKVMWSLVDEGSKRNIEFPLLDLSTYTPKTAPLPIVNPCHRCGTNHDEANPPPYCVKIMELEAEFELLNERVAEMSSFAYDAGFDNGMYVSQTRRNKVEYREIKKPKYLGFLQFAIEQGITPPTEAQNG